MTYALVAAGLVAFIGAVRAVMYFSRLARLRRVTVAKAGALPDGGARVRIVGRVRTLDGVTVAAPFTGRPGVVAVYELWEASRGRKVHRVDRHVVCAPFLVEDETGSVRVIADEVETFLAMNEVRERDADKNAFGAGVIAANQLAASHREEAVLQVGDPVAVIGRVANGALIAGDGVPLVVSNHRALLS